MQQEAKRSAAVHTLAARPDFKDIIARIRKLAPEIGARALSAEKAKRIPAETMDALRDTNVFRMMQPKRFGVYEYGPAERACRLRAWTRLRQHGMVRDAGSLFRLDGGLLSA